MAVESITPFPSTIRVFYRKKFLPHFFFFLLRKLFQSIRLYIKEIVRWLASKTPTSNSTLTSQPFKPTNLLSKWKRCQTFLFCFIRLLVISYWLSNFFLFFFCWSQIISFIIQLYYIILIVSRRKVGSCAEPRARGTLVRACI